MRAIETALIVLVAIGSLRCMLASLRPRRGLARGIAGAFILLTPFHLLLEGARWQLLPAYVAGLVLVTSAWRPLRELHPRSVRAMGAFGIGTSLAAAGLAWALPIPTLPAVSGDMAVGTTTFRLLDPTREERYSATADDAREVVVQAWYPTTGIDRPLAPFVERPWAFGASTARWLGLPGFSLSHLGLVQTSSHLDAPVAVPDERYPVVVYAHGWGGFRRVQVDLMEELASQGYVVLAMDHTYGAVATVFPDGPVVPIEPTALPADASQEEYDAAAAVLAQTFAMDIHWLLRELDASLAAEHFDDTVDLQRVAIIGHSTGGGAAYLACARQSSCLATAGLDPWVEPLPEQLLSDGLDVPMFSIRSAGWVGGRNDGLLGRLHAASAAPQTRMWIAGTDHRDFTLLGMLSPVAGRMGLTGTTAVERTHQIVEEYLVSFLDAHLQGEPSTLLERTTSPYPEVTIDAPAG